MPTSAKPNGAAKRVTRGTPKKQMVAVDWKVTFLDALRESPIISEACKAAGVSRTTAYRHRDLAPEFAVDWEKALRIGMSSLEDVAIKRAKDGSDTLMIFLLKAHDPDKYQDRSRVNLKVDLTKLSDEELRRIADGGTP